MTVSSVRPPADPDRARTPGVRAWAEAGHVYVQLLVPRPWWAFWRPRSMRVWLSPKQAIHLAGTVRGLAERAWAWRARRPPA